MKANLNIYGDSQTQHHAAFSMILFGAENIKRAGLIKSLDKLRTYSKMMNLGLEYNRHDLLSEFMFDYVIDSVRIVMFFEAYMKAEIIIADCCIHNINRNGANADLVRLAGEQQKKPVKLKDIRDAEPFIIDPTTKEIEHKHLNFTTLNFSILVKPQYRSLYQLTDSLIEAIKFFNDVRNRLHFSTELEFQLSSLLVDSLNEINDFVDATIEKWKQKFQL